MKDWGVQRVTLESVHSPKPRMEDLLKETTVRLHYRRYTATQATGSAVTVVDARRLIGITCPGS